MTAMIARKLDEIDITLDNKALNEENYNDYYVITKKGRGEDPTSTIIRKLKKLEDKNMKILFSGFKGCGKSTELLRLKKELEDEFLIKIFSVKATISTQYLMTKRQACLLKIITIYWLNAVKVRTRNQWMSKA